MPTATAVRGRPGKTARRYDLDDEFYKQALREASYETLFSDLDFSEKEVVKLKPGFDTACWAYVPPHRIYIGTDLFEKENVKEGLSDELQTKYICNHYHHERGHAVNTERDMALVKKALAAIEAPFPVFNLFEDARMEQWYRTHAKYQFEWLLMENLDFSPRAESLLFALIQAEGDLKVVQASLKDWEPKKPDLSKNPGYAAFAALFAPDPKETREMLEKKLPRVFEYYERIIASRDTMALMPILNAWLDEFGRPPQQMPQGGRSGEGGGKGEPMEELELSAELMTVPGKAEEFDEDAEDVRGSSPDDPLLPGKSKKQEPESANYTPEGAKGTVLHRSSTEVDLERAEKLANKFLKFFEEKLERVSTRAPKRRISARHYGLGRAPYRKSQLKGRGVKDVVVEVDCSGSMGGFHIDEGKVLVTALSLLAKRRRVTGHVILSAVNGSTPMWETYKLPVAQEVINRIQGYASAEGLEFALKGNLDILREADYVFVYTDGQICDAPIQKAFFHRYGIYTWGLYAGEEKSYLDELLRYFDKAILRDNAEALIDTMLAQNR